MGKYLDSSGVTYLWGKIKGLFTDSELQTESKTYQGAINEIHSELPGWLTDKNIDDLTQTDVTVRETTLYDEIKEETQRLSTQVSNSYDNSALPLLCGQPPILFGAGTPKESVVPDNWRQYDPATGEGYNWNGRPSAVGQQYIDTTAQSGGRYVAARDGEWDLKWINS